MRHPIPLRRMVLLALVAALTLTVSACTGLVQTSAPTAAPTSPPVVEPPAATASPGATATPLATATRLPTETSVPTATAEMTATAVPSPTPDPALREVVLSGLAWMPHYNMLLSFNFPGPVNAEDYRVTLEDKEYRCEVLEQYPNRLYCYGPGAKVLTTAMIRVYPAGSDQPGYEKSYWIPYFQ